MKARTKKIEEDENFSNKFLFFLVVCIYFFENIIFSFTQFTWSSFLTHSVNHWRYPCSSFSFISCCDFLLKIHKALHMATRANLLLYFCLVCYVVLLASRSCCSRILNCIQVKCIWCLIFTFKIPFISVQLVPSMKIVGLSRQELCLETKTLQFISLRPSIWQFNYKE